MNCPFCDYHDSKVMDSRDVNDGIRRRRQCLKCGSQPTGIFVIKKDRWREEFSKEMLLVGFRRDC